MRAAKKRCNAPGCPNLTMGKHCPEHTTQFEQKRRARFPREGSTKRGYGAVWQRIRLVVLERDPWCCHCRTQPSVDVDHVKPKAAGGTDELENLQGICKACHQKKTRYEAARYTPGG